MTFSEYLSKRISWDPPSRLPRLSIPSTFCRRPSTNGTLNSDLADDSSTEVTKISYPKSPATGGRARLHAYIRKISGSFNRRSKPRTGVPAPEPSRAKLDSIGMPTIHSTFQVPPSPSSPSTPSTSSTLPTSEPTAMSQLRMDRAIRAEQDAAYDRVQQLDKERLEKLREKRLQEEELSKRLAEKEEQEKIREREEAAYRRAQNDWRRWARRALVPPPPIGSGIQFAVRLPCGQRCVGTLPSDASLETLHIFSETLLIPSSFSPEDDPEDPPVGYEHRWGSRLVTTNPRLVLPNDPDSKLCEFEPTKKGALLIVEEVEDASPREP